MGSARGESAKSEESTSGEKSASGVENVNPSRDAHIERKSIVSARKSPCKLFVQAPWRRRDGVGFVGGDGGGGLVGGDAMAAVAMAVAVAATKAVRWGHCWEHDR